jgi:hypothetical protein
MESHVLFDAQATVEAVFPDVVGRNCHGRVALDLR